MHDNISNIDIASQEPKVCPEPVSLDDLAPLGRLLDKSYRENDCCNNCVHSEIIIHQDMTESYCNYHRDSPPCVDFRANDPNEDTIFEVRRDWEVGHTVDLWGICDKYERSSG